MTVEIQPDPENGENGIPAYRPREYQVEMLDACMNDNTIVAVCPLCWTPLGCEERCADLAFADGYGHW